MKPADTLIDLLMDRADSPQKDAGYRFLLNGESKYQDCSYEELAREATILAAELQRRNLQGERALLLFPPGIDYIVSFFGCLLAGVIPVPAYPPDLKRIGKTLPRLRVIADDCKPKAALTSHSILKKVRPILFVTGQLFKMSWLSREMAPVAGAKNWVKPDIKPHDVAFLQYTSGSTSKPKGVRVTHANLLDNLRHIESNFGHTTESQGVIWLPPYHDMGLIGGVLAPLYTGFCVTLMSPLDFIRKPVRWLRAISDYKATTSGGPNFAYELALRRTTPEVAASLDLSSWEVAFNGAEPIRTETLEFFTERFARSGFKREAFHPCYGLAESTLIVTGADKGADIATLQVDEDSLNQDRVVRPLSGQAKRILVSCGAPMNGLEVVVVNPRTMRRLGGDRIGEILVKGESVADGYWGNPQATREAFDIYLSQQDGGSGPYMRTGDLGFFRDGQLYVCGRSKELIIIRGRNYYPQDIERAVDGVHPALRTGCLAAFGLRENDEEHVGLIAEVREPRKTNFDDVVRAIRRAINEKIQVKVHAIGLVPKDGVPKTSSGKIQRRLSQVHYQERKLKLVHQWREASRSGLN
jgi:acyl-CoA synthetase (AMP-forming)/AMP-acid ligase II